MDIVALFLLGSCLQSTLLVCTVATKNVTFPAVLLLKLCYGILHNTTLIMITELDKNETISRY